MCIRFPSKLFSGGEKQIADPAAIKPPSDAQKTAESIPTAGAGSGIRRSFRPLWASRKKSKAPDELALTPILGTRSPKRNTFAAVNVQTSDKAAIAKAIRAAHLTESEENAFRKDMDTMLKLAAHPGKSYQAKKAEFNKVYGTIIKNCEFTDNIQASKLRMVLGFHLRNQDPSPQTAASSHPGPTLSSSAQPIAPLPSVPDPGFDPDRTSRAFQIIYADYGANWGAPSEAKRIGSLGDTSSGEEVSAIVEGTVAGEDKVLSPKERARYDPYVSTYLTELNSNNRKFRNWLDDHGIDVVPNSGDGLNCLIISLMQHATGNYASAHREAVESLRSRLGESGMLHADNAKFVELVNMINTKQGVSMDVQVVLAGEGGRPYLQPRIDVGGQNQVVIWHQGMHYEALIARPPATLEPGVS